MLAQVTYPAILEYTLLFLFVLYFILHRILYLDALDKILAGVPA